jgi:hypothetical protein
MTEQPKAKGGEHGGKARIEEFRENPSIPAIALAQAGIDKNLAHRAVCLTKSAAQTAGCPFVACDQHDVLNGASTALGGRPFFEQILRRGGNVPQYGYKEE